MSECAILLENYGFETIDQITVQFDFNGNTESIIEDGIQLVPGAETTLNYPFSRLPDGEYKIDSRNKSLQTCQLYLNGGTVFENYPTVFVDFVSEVA